MDKQENIKKVAVVILNWNGKAYLEKFLPFVLKSSYPKMSLVIGDNGSTDGSVEFIQEFYPDIQLVETGANLGFAEGYNHVLKQVNADYFVLLNSDVEVTENWIEPVIEHMEADRQIAAAQPKILSYQDRHLFEHAGAAGGFMDYLGYPFCAGRIFDHLEVDQGQYNQSGEVFWASGAALFIKKEAWTQVGGFDGDFFAHMEEIDLCWRLQLFGYKIAYCAASTVFHIGGGTLQKENPFKTYLNFRNNLFMLQKNLPFWRALGVIFLRFWLDFVALCKFLFEGKRKDALAVSKAHLHFFRNFAKTAKKRSLLRQGIPVPYPSGIYPKSIIWNYFILGKKTFSQLHKGIKQK